MIDATNAPGDQRLCVIGLGYIGLPTAAMFATSGTTVLGVDINPRVVQTLKQGDVHIAEPGLNTLVRAALQSGKLSVAAAPEPADVFIISVPTPTGHPEDGEVQADLRHVRAAAEAVVPMLRAGNLVILESTVPPRTTVDLLIPVLETSGLRVSCGDGDGGELFVVHCPERVLPGKILDELVSNDRIAGGASPAAARRAEALYRRFVSGEIFLTDATTAEMVKLMENTFRDVNIALANEFALIADRIGVNVWEAIGLANHHPRVNILRPGPGVGGHCIAVDPWFLLQAAPQDASVIRRSREINDGMPDYVVRQVRRLTAGIATPSIACLGLAYKANVDDIRESPAVEVVERLSRDGFHVSAFDPHVAEAPQLACHLAPSLDVAVADAHLIVVLVDHREFAAIDPTALMTSARTVLDTRQCLDLAAWRAAGIEGVLLGAGMLRDQ
ncbi:MAG: nucleotide sugar dehydrogenase [Dehalococcoidia bacterium]